MGTFILNFVEIGAKVIVIGCLAMVLHELGHIIAAYILQVKIRSIGVSRKGLYVIRDYGTPKQNLVISFCGPLLNLYLALASVNVHPLFFLANLCLFVFNIIPIKGSDGERIIKCIGEIRNEKLNAGPTDSGVALNEEIP